MMLMRIMILMIMDVYLPLVKINQLLYNNRLLGCNFAWTCG